MSNSPMPETRQAELDYKLVFDLMPGMCLVLDPSFNIVAQNAEHAHISMTIGKQIVGKHVFEAFPENPADRNTRGMSALRESLIRVLKTRMPDVMPVIRYDVQPLGGDYQVRYWAVINTPIIGRDGFVQWIINRADDVTDIVERRLKEVH